MVVARAPHTLHTRPRVSAIRFCTNRPRTQGGIKGRNSVTRSIHTKTIRIVDTVRADGEKEKRRFVTAQRGGSF